MDGYPRIKWSTASPDDGEIAASLFNEHGSERVRLRERPVGVGSLSFETTGCGSVDLYTSSGNMDCRAVLLYINATSTRVYP